MTQAQEEAFDKVVEILKEHFEGSLLIVTDELDDGLIARMQYNGGLLQAIGLARAGEHKMLQRQAAAIAFRDELKDEG